MKIKRESYNKIVIIGNDDGAIESFIESQTVEANILYEILNTLKELKAYIVNTGITDALKKE